MTFEPAVHSVVLALLLSACGGSNDRRPPETPQAEAPPPPPPPHESAPAAPAPAASVAVARPEGCAVRCIGASGAHPVDGELENQIGAALGSSFDGMRACMREDGYRSSYSPMMVLRFGAIGQLTFVGVDTAGFEGNEACLNDVAARATPALTMNGRAVLRCSEQCRRERQGTGGRRSHYRW